MNKLWANFQKIIELFTKKFVKKLFKLWAWDPGSEIRDPGSGKNPFRIRDPGSWGQKGTRSRIRIRNTACKYQLFMIGRFRLRACSAKSRLNSSSDTLSTGTDSWPCKYQRIWLVGLDYRLAQQRAGSTAPQTPCPREQTAGPVSISGLW